MYFTKLSRMGFVFLGMSIGILCLNDPFGLDHSSLVAHVLQQQRECCIGDETQSEGPWVKAE